MYIVFVTTALGKRNLDRHLGPCWTASRNNFIHIDRNVEKPLCMLKMRNWASSIEFSRDKQMAHVDESD